MSRRRVWAIVRKDLTEVTSSKSVMVPMVIAPLVLCVVLPAVVLLVGLSGATAKLNGMDLIGKLVARYPVPAGFGSIMDQVMFVFLNYSFLPFFMIIPVLASSIIAANSVVGEKERGTLETLLYTPISNRELVEAKLLSSFIPSLVVTAGGFLGYFLVSNAIFWAYRGQLIVRSVIWIPALLLLAPSVSLLGLSITLLVSLRAKTYIEAQQLSAMVVIPFVVLLYAQIGGLLVLSPLWVVGLGIAALVVSYVIYGKIGPRFSREQILMTL
ncbi:MAG TPA: ABC transporter permease subunit [Spirochaetia bacterium]|nr:ABC transporter permease subunit [Spirochaetia bacterium]